MKRLLWLGLALLAVLAGCDMFSRDFARDPGDIVDPTKGSVVLLFDGSALPTKTIVPNSFSMNISSYKLTFTPPVGSPYSETITSLSSKTYSGLTTGNWSVQVHAFNNADPDLGTLIGSIDGSEAAKADYTITAGGVEVVDVAVVPITGTGTLNLSVAWTATAIVNPELEATLDGASIAPGVGGGFGAIGVDPLDSTRQKTSYINAALGTGYYPLVLRLYGTDPSRTLVWGWVEAVRIVNAQTSVKDWVLVAGLSGQLELNADSNMQNPFGISFTPATISSFSALNGLAVSAQVDAGVSVSSYAWYLDGSVLTAGSDGVTTPVAGQIIFAAGSPKLTVGNHNLSVLVTSTGGVISSNTIAFTVTP